MAWWNLGTFGGPYFGFIIMAAATQQRTIMFTSHYKERSSTLITGACEGFQPPVLGDATYDQWSTTLCQGTGPLNFWPYPAESS